MINTKHTIELEIYGNFGNRMKFEDVDFFTIKNNRLTIENKFGVPLLKKRVFVVYDNGKVVWSDEKGTKHYLATYDSRKNNIKNNSKQKIILRKSADGIKAPVGWMFQDNEKDFVSMVRVSKKGMWKVDWKETNDRSLKDAYASAQYYDKRTGWECTSYSPNEGHSSGIRQRNKIDAIKELKRVARLLDKWDKK